MKNRKILIKAAGLSYILFLLFFSIGCSASSYNISENDHAYNLDELNSYGEWININNYGRVWRPFAINGWMPFDNGNWTYANANWMWVSHEPFGRIVYHYGYWFDDLDNGWVWIPSDDIWSPANVIWMNYGDYICWAPLTPKGIRYGHPWDRDDNHYWHSVKVSDFTKDNIRDYRVIHPIRTESGDRIVNYKQPDRKLLEKNSGKSVSEINTSRDILVNTTDRKIDKMRLPQPEKKRVDQYSSPVKNDLLSTRDVHQKQQTVRKKK
jgi:hypothetical protein